MTAAEFKARYPEFATAPDAFVTAVIAEQEVMVSDSWGDRRGMVLSLSVADALSRSPKARNARINLESQSEAVENPYSAQLKTLKLAFGWTNNRT
jgi:hypothetical protein